VSFSFFSKMKERFRCKLTTLCLLSSDMIRIMQEFGSEVSNQTLPKRKESIKKASIVRQFRRWNPEFFRYFIHVNGEWVPKLGRDGELQRRAEKRQMMKQAQGKP
jgi:hypothetical protein